MQDHLRNHFGHLPSSMPDGRVDADDTLYVVDSGLDCDTFNAVIAKGLPHDSAEARVRAAIASFGSRAFSWWHGPDAPAFLPELLGRCGVSADEQEIAMRLDVDQPVVEPTPVPDLAIRRVSTDAALGHYASIIAANWSPPDPNVITFYARAREAVLRRASPLLLFVGYLGDTPVATAELATGGDGVAGIYSIATLTEWRGRGIGSSVTAAVIAAGWSTGARAIELQASRDGVGIYRRLGFQDYGIWTEFKPG